MRTRIISIISSICFVALLLGVGVYFVVARNNSMVTGVWAAGAFNVRGNGHSEVSYDEASHTLSIDVYHATGRNFEIETEAIDIQGAGEANAVVYTIEVTNHQGKIAAIGLNDASILMLETVDNLRTEITYAVDGIETANNIENVENGSTMTITIRYIVESQLRDMTCNVPLIVVFGDAI